MVARENRKARAIRNGYIPRPKGRPRKKAETEEIKRNNELVQLTDAGTGTAKFSVRSWKEVKIKYRVVERLKGKYSVGALCSILEVSRSGYYAWRRRQGRIPKDQWLVELIMECQEMNKQTYGCRRVQRWLDKVKNKHVNIKAIRRIMRKYDLLAQIRRRKPYVDYKRVFIGVPIYSKDNSIKQCQINSG